MAYIIYTISNVLKCWVFGKPAKRCEKWEKMTLFNGFSSLALSICNANSEWAKKKDTYTHTHTKPGGEAAATHILKLPNENATCCEHNWIKKKSHVDHRTLNTYSCIHVLNRNFKLSTQAREIERETKMSSAKDPHTVCLKTPKRNSFSCIHLFFFWGRGGVFIWSVALGKRAAKLVQRSYVLAWVLWWLRVCMCMCVCVCVRNASLCQFPKRFWSRRKVFA